MEEPQENYAAFGKEAKMKRVCYVTTLITNSKEPKVTYSFRKKMKTCLWGNVAVEG